MTRSGPTRSASEAKRFQRASAIISPPSSASSTTLTKCADLSSSACLRCAAMEASQRAMRSESVLPGTVYVAMGLTRSPNGVLANVDMVSKSAGVAGERVRVGAMVRGGADN